MNKVFHLAFWTIFVVLLSALAWLSVSLLEFDRKSREEQQKQNLNEQVRLCLWRLDSYLSQFLFEANKRAPKDFSDRQGIDVSGASDNYAVACFDIEHDNGIPFSSGKQGVTLFGDAVVASSDHSDNGQRIARLRERIRNLGISRADGESGRKDEPGERTRQPKIAQGSSDYGLWLYSSRYIPWEDPVSFFPSSKSEVDQDLNQMVLYKTAFAPRWVDDDLVLMRFVETPWRTFTQVILLDWGKLKNNLLALTRDILPGASLAPYRDADMKPDHVTRLLAGLPLIIDPGIPPDPNNGQVTDTLKVSLILIWGAALIAMGGVALLLFGMMRLNERRSMFVSTVTHELRTPLTTLDMYAEMLMYGFVPPDEYDEYFAGMRQESGRLRRLVDNVLGFSRIERSVNAYQVSAMVGSELCRNILACIEPIIKRAGMDVVAAVSDAASNTEVMANREAVCQIMGNLADNAVKYALTLPGTVALDMNVADGFFEITFQDSGPGIPAHVLRKLFKPFSRPLAGDKSGMGLGLYLSRRMARTMGGDLSLERSLSTGAKFRLTLPLKAS